MPDDVVLEPPVSTPAEPASTPAAPVATPAAPEFKFPEDRTNWVPQDKHRAAEAAANKLARELERHKTELALERRRRIADLSGANPPSPEDDEQKKIAEAFYALPQFAHLKGLTPEVMAKLTALAERGEEHEAAVKHQWDGLARRTFQSVVGRIQDELELDTLDDEQAEEIKDSFRRFARYQPDAEAFRQRYEAEDPKIVEEFVARYMDKVVNPIRRSAAASLTRPTQARVPRGGTSQPVVTQKPKLDFSKMNDDQARQAAEDAAVEYLKEHGMLQSKDDRW